MPRQNKSAIKGGRASYTGKNAYAQQGFENDLRQSTLGGLAMAYLASDRNTVAADATAIAWGTALNANTGASNIFLRGFKLLPDGATLFCMRPGTYKISWSIRFGNLPASTNGIVWVQVIRNNTQIYKIASVVTNGSATVTIQTQQSPPPVIVDLLQGDQINMFIQSPGAGNQIGGFYSTGLVLEQIDLAG